MKRMFISAVVCCVVLCVFCGIAFGECGEEKSGKPTVMVVIKGKELQRWAADMKIAAEGVINNSDDLEAFSLEDLPEMQAEMTRQEIMGTDMDEDEVVKMGCIAGVGYICFVEERTADAGTILWGRVTKVSTNKPVPKTQKRRKRGKDIYLDIERLVEEIIKDIKPGSGPGRSSNYTIPDPLPQDVKDPNDKRYKTRNIGGKRWMAENLNYCDGRGCGSWPKQTPSMCYDGKQANCDTYGMLYDWGEAKSICDNIIGGAHLPTRGEWNALLTAAGGKEEAGYKLKSQDGWEGDYGNGSKDGTGFNALPGGYKDKDKNSQNIGVGGYWWIASGEEFGSRMRMTSENSAVAAEDVKEKGRRYSVRCVVNNK